MKKSVVLSSLVAASLFAVSGLAGAQGAASMENPYVISPDGELVKNGTGLCCPHRLLVDRGRPGVQALRPEVPGRLRVRQGPAAEGRLRAAAAARSASCTGPGSQAGSGSRSGSEARAQAHEREGHLRG